MCGIAGYQLTRTQQSGAACLRQSLEIMAHRGPDDEGIALIDPDRNIYRDLITENSACSGRARCSEAELQHRIAFGHRRFSIVDVSPGGHQPFWCSDAKVCVAFNGEIYNYVELRDELKEKGFTFRTVSDTEVLAIAYRVWGVKCFERFNGFWALSLYDQNRRQVLLARDRIGKAPLYVTHNRHGLYWASEIKGLLSLLGSSPSLHEQAVIDFVKWRRRDLFHETFYEGVNSFPNAAYAWVESDGSYRPVTYWTIPTRRLTANDISIPQAKKRVKELLGDAVRLRLRADVPVSVQLSGGIDSSSLLAIAASNASSKVHAYTVAYSDSEVNEEPFARQVANYYSSTVDYSVIEPPAEDILDHADSYVHLMGEPFHSPNQFTSHRIWRTMSSHGFRATLYGAGGDEVFAGYPTDYFQPYLRYLLSHGHGWRFLKEFALFSEHRPGRLGFDYFSRGNQLVLHQAVRLLPWAARLYHTVIKDRIPKECDPFVAPETRDAHCGPSDEIHDLMIDYMTDWLMNYWLRIDNQNSMGVPIELRSPFLDYRVVELGFSLPLEFLIRDGWMKWILRSAMEDQLPQGVVWRKQKVGFPFPLNNWLGRVKDRLLSMIQPLDSPYLNMKKFVAGYETIRQYDPSYLWCLISLAMWWKRCVQGERLVA